MTTVEQSSGVQQAPDLRGSVFVQRRLHGRGNPAQPAQVHRWPALLLPGANYDPVVFVFIFSGRQSCVVDDAKAQPNTPR